MSNFSRIQSMDETTVWKTFEKLFDNPFRKYIDYSTYLKSSDPDIKHFIRHDEYAIIEPTEAELAIIKFNTEKEKIDYVARHTKKMCILEHTNICGMKYVIVADFDHNICVKIPESNVFVVKGRLF